MNQAHRFGIDRQTWRPEVTLSPVGVEIPIKNGELSGSGAGISHEVEPGIRTV